MYDDERACKPCGITLSSSPASVYCLTLLLLVRDAFSVSFTGTVVTDSGRCVRSRVSVSAGLTHASYQQILSTHCPI